MKSYEIKEEITVKQLYSSLPHSYTGLRLHYKRLIDDGWFEQVPDRGDRRVKYIQPSEALLKKMDELLTEISF
jgi:DNA-binding MarR family transcriptional regulator